MLKKYFYSLTILSWLFSSSQNVELLDVVPPSPMAYELTRFDAQQPNLYTGTATINIPLYTIDFDGWKLPLSLNYRASGITTNQEATEAGLGWSLNATAVISRSVASGNDLQNTANHTGYIYDPNNYNEIFNDLANLTKQERFSLKEKIKTGVLDAEPDIFSYNLFGFSGTFVLSKINNDGIVEVKKINKDGVKIVFDENSKNFTITTPTGYVAYFTIKERSTNFSGSHNDIPYGAGLGIYSTCLSGAYVDILNITNRGNFRVITSWYLKKLISPNGKEINFNYNIDENEESDYISITNPSFGEFIQIDDNRWTQRQFSRTVNEHVYLSSIEISTELSIAFTMADREDLSPNNLYTDAFPPYTFYNCSPLVEIPPGLKKPLYYTNVDITGLLANSTFSKHIQLNHSYFNQHYLHEDNDEFWKYQYLRLRLDKVFIDDQAYTMTYNLGENGLPYKSILAMDSEGFYNGKHDNTFLSVPKNGITDAPIIRCEEYDSTPLKRFYYTHASRMPNLSYAIAGSLNKIQYPTKGSSVFKYELHDFYSDGRSITNPFTYLAPATNSSGAGGNIPYGGLRILKIENKDSNGVPIHTKSYSYRTKFSTNSSGVLMMPKTYLAFKDDRAEIEPIDPNAPCEYYLSYARSIPGQNTAQGSNLAYNRVVETLESNYGNISTAYEFTSEPTAFGNLHHERTPSNYKNGQLT